MKILFIDVETTGIEHKLCGIWSIAGIVYENGINVGSFALDMNPGDVHFDKYFFKHSQVSVLDLQEYPTSNFVFGQFMDFLRAFVDPSDRDDKFILAGYNAIFDKLHIEEWFNRNDMSKHWPRYFNPETHDVMGILSFLLGKDRKHFKNIKLSNVCNIFGIDLNNAHDAEADITATAELYFELKNYCLPLINDEEE